MKILQYTIQTLTENLTYRNNPLNQATLGTRQTSGWEGIHVLLSRFGISTGHIWDMYREYSGIEGSGLEGVWYRGV